MSGLSWFGGGWRLARPLDQVTLGQVNTALGEPGLFPETPPVEADGCLVEAAVNDALAGTYAAARALLDRAAAIVEALAGTAVKDDPDDLKKLRRYLDQRIAKPGPRNLPAAPLMHGTGAFNAMWNLVLAGSVVTVVGRHFDEQRLLDVALTVERTRPWQLVAPGAPG